MTAVLDARRADLPAARRPGVDPSCPGGGPGSAGARPRPVPPGGALAELSEAAPRVTSVRRDAGLGGYERALRRAGFAVVAGADEAGRGACAGPLVVAAVALPDGRRGAVPGLADSKLLTAAAREAVYEEVVARALAWHVVVIGAAEVDARGLHVANVEGMRRAVAGLRPGPSYVLTDGFPVPGLPSPALAVWKGDRVAACVAAASVVAKVTRDRIMLGLHERWPQYEFARHKGYTTPEHSAALRRHGPCPEHRFSYVNVAAAGAPGAPAVAAGAPPPAAGGPAVPPGVAMGEDAAMRTASEGSA